MTPTDLVSPNFAATATATAETTHELLRYFEITDEGEEHLSLHELPRLHHRVIGFCSAVVTNLAAQPHCAEESAAASVLLERFETWRNSLMQPCNDAPFFRRTMAFAFDHVYKTGRLYMAQCQEPEPELSLRAAYAKWAGAVSLAVRMLDTATTFCEIVAKSDSLMPDYPEFVGSSAELLRSTQRAS